MPQIATTKLHIGRDYYLPGDRVPANDDVFEDLLELIASGAIAEGEPTSDGPSGQGAQILAHVRVEKYHGGEGIADERAADPDVEPDEVLESEDNLLLIGGASALLQRLIGTAITAFDNSNAHLGVGDSTTAAADTQTDLQASTNKLRKAMDSTYPQHSDSTSSSGAKTITFRATYGTSEANFAWQEWIIANASAAGRALNRKVESLGTKTSAQAWQLTVTLSLA